jgi:hypothetical protein
MRKIIGYERNIFIVYLSEFENFDLYLKLCQFFYLKYI